MERTFGVVLLEYLNGEGGLSLLISFGLHCLLLAALAIPIMKSIQQEVPLTTIIQNGPEEFVSMGEAGGIELSLPDLESFSSLDTKEFLPEMETIGPALLPEVNPSDIPLMDAPASLNTGKSSGRGKGNGQGDGIGDGSGAGLGGMRLIEPSNAIKAGNFSVWPWPILGTDSKKQAIHGEPGSSPKIFQPYHIVIRLRVPEGKRTVNLSDFDGSVVGTDAYFQKIPRDAWFFNENGELVRARTGRSIPVIEGTAELLIRVPASPTAAVRDTITVSSRLTDEEQKIELEFQDFDSQ